VRVAVSIVIAVPGRVFLVEREGGTLRPVSMEGGESPRGSCRHHQPYEREEGRTDEGTFYIEWEGNIRNCLL